MKKIFLICLIVISWQTSAQISRGTFSVSGSFSYASSSQEIDGEAFDPFTGEVVDYTFKSKSRGLTFAPRVGYFISRSLVAGVEISLESTKGNSNQPGAGVVLNDYQGRSLGVGPFVRYYVPVSEKLLLFADGTIQAHRQKTESKVTYFDGFGGVTISEMTVRTRERSWSVGAGGTYLMGKAVGVELLLAYVKRSEEEFNITQKTISLSVGLQLLLNNR